MAANITFANYAPYSMETGLIYDIGAGARDPGVIPQIAEQLGHVLTAEPDVDNLGVLQAQIEGIGAALSEDEEVASTLVRAAFPVETVRGWVDQSGILTPVERTYATGEAIPDGHIDIAVILGAGHAALHDRLRRFDRLAETHHIGRVLLAVGAIPLERAVAGDGGDMYTEEDVMRREIMPQLVVAGYDPVLRATDSTDRGWVYGVTGVKLIDMIAPHTGQTIVNVSNTPDWVISSGGLLRAARNASLGVIDARGRQFSTVAGELGAPQTAEALVSEHNVVATVSKIVRSAQELARHQRRAA